MVVPTGAKPKSSDNFLYSEGCKNAHVGAYAPASHGKLRSGDAKRVEVLRLADQLVVGFEVVEKGAGGGVEADFLTDLDEPFLFLLVIIGAGGFHGVGPSLLFDFSFGSPAPDFQSKKTRRPNRTAGFKVPQNAAPLRAIPAFAVIATVPGARLRLALHVGTQQRVIVGLRKHPQALTVWQSGATINNLPAFQDAGGSMQRFEVPVLPVLCPDAEARIGFLPNFLTTAGRDHGQQGDEARHQKDATNQPSPSG